MTTLPMLIILTAFLWLTYRAFHHARIGTRRYRDEVEVCELQHLDPP